MSFASEVKNELCTKGFGKNCCMRSELAAFILFTAHVDGDTIKIVTENPSVARRVFSLFKRVVGVNASVVIKKHAAAHSLSMYHVTVQRDGFRILRNIGVMQEMGGMANYRIDNQMLRNECCMRAFVRGVFLSCGSMVDPEKGYHLEFVTHRRRLSNDMVALLNEFEIESKVVVRKSNYVIYLKNSEFISDVLNICGATNALMELENIRILKEMKNNVNRMVNCETANVSKVVNAAVRQTEAIQKIADTITLEDLPDGLRELAYLRLENPEASLGELGAMLDPAISKSGVNHRLRKLIQIAQEL